MKQYKHKLILAAKVKPLISEETDKYLSIASKSKLKDFLPSNVDFEKKIDFLGFSGEFCTVNRLNGNDDAIQTKEALEIVKLLPFSFIDTEHSRKAIVGVITSAHFNEFGSNKVLSAEEVKDFKKPFNITVAGIIWRLVNPDLAEYVESSGDKDSENYGKIFLSWELLFDKANLIEMDAGKKNLQDGQVITDESEIEKLENKLRANGGKGYTDNGKRLGRIPVDEIIPAGCALTENPAGEDLKPITILSAGLNIVEKDGNSESSEADKKGFSDISTKEAYSGKDKSEEIKNQPIQQNVTDMVKNQTKSDDISKTTNKDIPPKKPDYKFGKCPNCGGVSDYNSFIKTWDSSMGTMSCDSCSKKSLTASWEFNENNIWKGKETAENVAQDKKHEIVANNENKMSHSETLNVNKNNKTMKISSIKDITDENLKQSSNASAEITDVLNSEIKKISDSFTKDKEEKENLVKTTNQKFEATNATLEKTTKELEEVKANLDKIVKENEQKAKIAAFSARMNTIETEFDLNDKEREILGSKIKSIDKDEDFTKFLEETQVLLAAKKKNPFAKKDDKKNDDDADDKGKDSKKDDKKQSKASKEDDDKANVVDDAIKNGEKKETIIANSTSGSSPTLGDRMKNAFGITNWSVENKKKNRE